MTHINTQASVVYLVFNSVSARLLYEESICAHEDGTQEMLTAGMAVLVSLFNPDLNIWTRSQEMDYK